MSFAYGYGAHRRRGDSLTRWRSVSGLALDISADNATFDGSNLVSTAPDVIGGIHATASGAQRPLYVANVRNGRPALRFTAASQHMMTVGALALVKPYTVVCIVQPHGAALANGRSLSATGANWQLGLLGAYYHTHYNGAEFVAPSTDIAAVLDTPHIEIARSSSAAAGSKYLRDGVDRTGTVAGTALNPSSFNIGANSLGSEHANMDFFRLLVWRRELSFAEMRTVFNALSAYYNISVTNLVETLTVSGAGYLQDSAIDTFQGGAHRLHSPLSRVALTTSATSLVVNAASNDTSGLGYNEIEIFKDGVHDSTFEAAPTNVTRSTTLSLDGALHEIEFVGGTHPSNGQGTSMVSVTAVAGTTTVMPTTAPVRRLVVYGDSIAGGQISTVPGRDGWIAQLRATSSDLGVAVEQYGGRALYSDCDTAPHRAALVARLVALATVQGTGRVDIWLAIGVNDYGQSTQTAAAFATQYGALVDDLHTALPTANIYAQTLIVGTSTGANGVGSTRADYNSAISGLTSGRAWLTVVDASAFVSLGNLNVDGVHPADAGHVTYAAAVASTLGV